MFYGKSLEILNYNMNETEALKELTREKLINHCIKQCKNHKDNKIGYEHYIFLQLLKESNFRFIEDCIIDYYLICKGELTFDG